MKGLGWLGADPYLGRHLAEHAAAGGALDDLMTDVGFLAIADPATLLPAVRRLTRPDARRIAGLYQRAAERLYRAGPVERMALLHLTAQQEAPDLVPKMQPLLPSLWQSRWAHWERSSPHLRLLGHDGTVSAVAFGHIDRQPMIISGGLDSTIRIWNAHTGLPQGDPMVDDGPVRTLAVGTVDGETVIVSGGEEGIRVWRASDSSSPFIRLRNSVLSVALGDIDGEPLIISGGPDSFVELWNAQSGRQKTSVVIDHGSPVSDVTIGVIEGEPVIVSGGNDQTVRVWDARSGTLRGVPLLHDDMSSHLGTVLQYGQPGGIEADHYAYLLYILRNESDDNFSVDIGEINGVPSIISCGTTGTVRAWDARTLQPWADLPPIEWQLPRPCASVAFRFLRGEPVIAAGDWVGGVYLAQAHLGRAVDQRFLGHRGKVSSVAVGEADGCGVVVSGGEDGSVRVWDSDTVPQKMGALVHGYSCVTVGTINEVQVVVAGTHTGKIRVFDVYTGRRQGKQIAGPRSAVRSVTLGEVDGASVIVSVGAQGAARVRDARTSKQFGRTIHVGDEESLVSVAEVDGELVIVSATHDTLQMWDVRTRRRRWQLSHITDGYVSALAVGQGPVEPVAVLGEYDILRLVGLRSGSTVHKWRHDHGVITSLATGTIDEESVIISGGDDGTVRVWWAGTGRRQGELRVGHAAVGSQPGSLSLAVGEINSQPVIVSGSDAGVVHVWDPIHSRSIVSLEPGAAIRGLALGSQGDLAIATDDGLVMVDML